MKTIYLLGGALALLANTAHARPVSYAGGTMVMTENDDDSHSLHLLYSPTATTAFGVVSEYWRNKDWWFNGAQFNWLAKRWNMPDSQANLYVMSAAGVATSDFRGFDHKSQAAGFTGIEADWEDRDYFLMYENHLVEAGDIDRFFKEKVRVGVTPYVGEYGDLHTWLMLQVEHSPEDEHPITVTPLVRLFKGSHLAEAGISNYGDIMVNYTIQF